MKASHGPRARPAQEEAGRRTSKKGFAAEYEVLPTRKKVARRAEGGGQGRRGRSTWPPTPTARARPSAGTWPRSWASEDAKKRKIHRVVFNEITKKRDRGGLQEPERRRREEGGRPAGAPHPRPPGGLRGEPDPLGQGPARPLRGPRAVGGPEAHLRPRARDPRLRARGVLDGGGPPRGRAAARLPREPR